MSDEELLIAKHIDTEEPLTPELAAEVVGAQRTLIVRLVRLGVIEAIYGASGETLVPVRAVLRLRRMQRLRRDLGVNYAGANIILDLVEQVEQLKRSSALAATSQDFTEG